MGNKASSNEQPSDWLVASYAFDPDNKLTLSLIEGVSYRELLKSEGSKTLYVPDYKSLHQMAVSHHPEGTWEFYRDSAFESTQNPIFLEMAAPPRWCIVAQYHRSCSASNVVPDAVRKSLLFNLSRLSRDESVSFDVRDAESGRYFDRSTMRFGVDAVAQRFGPNPWFDPDDAFDQTDDVPLLKDKESAALSAPSSTAIQLELGGKDSHFRFKPPDDDPDRNTAFILDLIDPNKHLKEHILWIPTVFDCRPISMS